MSITKDKMNWECMCNHLPDWIEDNNVKFNSVMSEDDLNRFEEILNIYNHLTDQEEILDAFSQYGIENEKQELVDEVIKIHEKYKDKIKNL